MTETGDTGSEDPLEASEAQRYFRAIEDTFLALRGSPFLLSPADWRVARDWYETGIPLEVVEETMLELFRRRRERDSEARVSGLRYFDGAVKAAWKRRQEARGPDFRRTAAGGPEEIDLEEVLASLANAVPDELPGGRELARRIRRLSGSPPAVEEELRKLDEEMLESAREGLDPETRQALSRRVRRSMMPLQDRHEEEELEVLRDQLRRRHLREMLELPLLSLFV